MYFEDSNFSKQLKYKKVSLDFGTYYLLDDFFIIEMNEWKRVVKFVGSASLSGYPLDEQSSVEGLKATVSSIEDALVHSASMERTLNRMVSEIVTDFDRDSDSRTMERLIEIESTLLLTALDFSLAVLDGQR